jgi:hypothetical protein
MAVLRFASLSKASPLKQEENRVSTAGGAPTGGMWARIPKAGREAFPQDGFANFPG